MNRAPSLLAFSFLLAACGSVPAPVPEDPILEWDRELPAGVLLDDRYAGKAWWKPVRVLDADTGLPVPGARVDNWWEADWPGAEPWEDCLAQSGVTDEDGYVLVRNKVDYGNWFYVEAEGYGPIGAMSFEDEHRIRRGRDAALEVRDGFGRPIAGAVVEYILGCGHTASARVGTTGADGRTVLRCIDLADTDSLWIRAEGAEGDSDAYGWSFDSLPVVDGVRILSCEPGPAVSGVVRYHDGSPAAGAYVGTRTSHRGPWTAAGPDGRFRLLGAPPWELLTVDAPPPAGSPEGAAWIQGKFRSAPGADQVVLLPPPGEDPDSWEPIPEVPLRVTVRASGEILPYGRLRLVAFRPSDGRTEVAEPEILADEGGDGVSVNATLHLEPGAWTVTAGTPAGLLAPGTEEVVVGAEGGEVSFWLVENPVIRPAVLVRGKDGSHLQVEDVRAGAFSVVTEKESEIATPTPALDGSIHVPQEGPFAVVYEADRHWKARAVFEDGVRGAMPALVLPPPEEWPEEPDRDTPRPGAFPPARLTVLYPDGSPARDADVTLRWTPEGGKPIEWFFGLDEEGSLEFPFRTGDRLEIEPRSGDDSPVDPTLPILQGRFDGPGPWILRWPSTEIFLRVVDPAGSPVDAFTWFSGGYENHWVEGGTLVLRGAPTGPLRFWIHADGWRARDVRLAVTAGEKREFVVRLETPEAEEELPEIPDGEPR